MSRIEQIKDQLEWGRTNLDSPQDNLSLEDVEWLIEQAEQVEHWKKAFENENKIAGKLQRKADLLESSLKDYKEDNDKFETSTHIDSFMYDMELSDKGEILCLINVHGVEHSIGINEKAARGFAHMFEMQKIK